MYVVLHIFICPDIVGAAPAQNDEYTKDGTQDDLKLTMLFFNNRHAKLATLLALNPVWQTLVDDEDRLITCYILVV